MHDLLDLDPDTGDLKMQRSGSLLDVDEHSSRREVSRVAARIALALGVLSLSLALVFTADTNAQAYATAPGPVTIGQASKKVAPATVLKMGAGATPWGRAAKLAMLAYTTKDAWWPTTRKFLGNEETPGETGTGSKAACTSSAVVKVDPDNPAGWVLTFANNETISTGCNGGNGSFTSEITCFAPSTGAYSTAATSSNLAVGMYQTSGTVTRNACGAGQRIFGGTVSWTRDNAWPTVKARLPSAGLPNSEIEQTTTVQCRRPDGSMVTISDTQTGFGDRVAVPSCADRVPGSIPWTGSIKSGPKGGTQRELTSWTTDEAEWNRYGDCFGPSGLSCDIRVYVDGQPCTADRGVCVGWENLADDALTAPRVQCRFGSYTVPDENCRSLQYDTKVRPTPVRELDPDGEAWTSPNPRPPTEPSTGTGPSTGPQPTTPPLPTTGANPLTPRAKPDPTKDPDGTSCYSDMWSWNPVDWVYIPVKCALQWAFVPSAAGMKTLVSTLNTAWRDSSPGRWVNAVTGLAPTGSVSGCAGPRVNYVAMDVEVDFYPLDACSGTRAMVAGVTRVVASVLVIFGGFFAALRALGSGLGWDPRVGEKIT